MNRYEKMLACSWKTITFGEITSFLVIVLRTSSDRDFFLGQSDCESEFPEFWMFVSSLLVF